MENNVMRRQMMRRSAARKIGGGFDANGGQLVAQPMGAGSDLAFAVKAPVQQGYDDCAFPARPGQLFNQPNPALAQVAMVGGAAVDENLASHAYHQNGWTQVEHTGNRATAWGDPALAQTNGLTGGRRRRSSSRRRSVKKNRSRRRSMKKNRSRRAMKGGSCGCTGSRLFGGGSRRRARRSTTCGGRCWSRKMRGGAAYGFAIDPSVSIGGSGPNVDALRTPVPCDPPAGSMNPLSVSQPADPRAYGMGYSATPNTTLPSIQAGGAYSTGNGFSDDCYKAPGSMLPKYEAQTAGFTFYPSTASGGTLPDGVTAYEDVVPYAARMGGARRSRRGRKAAHGRRGRTMHRK